MNHRIEEKSNQRPNETEEGESIITAHNSKQGAKTHAAVARPPVAPATPESEADQHSIRNNAEVAEEWEQWLREGRRRQAMVDRHIVRSRAKAAEEWEDWIRKDRRRQEAVSP